MGWARNRHANVHDGECISCGSEGHIVSAALSPPFSAGQQVGYPPAPSWPAPPSCCLSPWPVQEMEHRIARAGGHRSDDEARALNARITDLSQLLEAVSGEHAMLTTQVRDPVPLSWQLELQCGKSETKQVDRNSSCNPHLGWMTASATSHTVWLK